MAKKRKKKSGILTLIIILLLFAIIYYCYVNGYIKIPDGNGENSSSSNNGNSYQSGDASSLTDLPKGGNGNLNVYFLDVGQGDCMFIVFPDGKTMIIDSGDNKSVAENKIKSTAENLSITSFDYMLLTHADADHVGKMAYVFENYEVRKVFRPNVLSTYKNASKGKDASKLNEGINVGVPKEAGGTVATSEIYYDFLFAMQEEGCQSLIFNCESDFSGSYKNGDTVLEYVFDFLTPLNNPSEIAYKNANDYSPIVKLTYNGVSICLTGDAESKMETEYLNFYGNLNDFDVLKVGHHGAETSTSKNFLAALSPEYAVISCGVTTKYKHPRQSILDRLSEHGTVIYRTDKNGDVVLNITAESDYVLSPSSFYMTNTDLSENLIGGDTYYNSLQSTN